MNEIALKTGEFQEACKKILGALDTDSAIKSTQFGYDTLELKGCGEHVELIVSNGVYYVTVSIPCADAGSGWHMTIDGKLFLSLVSKFTTDEVELSQDGNSLAIKANGSYRLPLKYGDGGIVEIPEIGIGEVAAQFPIKGSVLLSIAEENSKELAKKKATRPVQQLYYVDEHGCITWTNSSACVNTFELAQPIRFFMQQKVSRLLKLLSPSDVSFRLGHAEVGQVVQTRIEFSQGGVSIRAITPSDEGLSASLPLEALRGRATKDYESKAVLDAGMLSSAIDRLSLFCGSNQFASAEMSFGDSSATIREGVGNNEETIPVEGGSNFSGKSFGFRLDAFKSALSGSQGGTVELGFDGGAAFVVSYGSIRNVSSKAKVD